MTVALDPPVRVGGAVVATLSRVEIVRKGIGRFVFISAGKVPEAVLIAHGRRVDAFAPDGRRLTEGDVEALCPGALDRFAR